MDPVCHSLVGAALARSGLGQRTALGAATLLIGANLPDVDVLAYLDGPAADLAFRRGWTHGIPALIAWPFALTAAMLLLDRLARRVRRAGVPSAVVPREILLLAAISVFTHPVLDTLNTYGVRWLMPFRDDWFYGDTLFIVDPWLWAALGVGVTASVRAARAGRRTAAAARPARLALAACSLYVIGMALSGAAARGIARRELAALGGGPVGRLMAAPRPLTPFARQLVAEQGDSYRVGSFEWLRSPHVDPASLRSFPRPRPDDPAMLAAHAETLGRRFLGWARFPVVRVEPDSAGGSLVHLIDVRYADRPGASFGSVTVRVPPSP
ncbi:MAG TPA: metal-dependent hydrolase [Gemmatimonadales bacterium]|nr:metal-dependent hydrolase [Gemmatimonadales bacterium]